MSIRASDRGPITWTIITATGQQQTHGREPIMRRHEAEPPVMEQALERVYGLYEEEAAYGNKEPCPLQRTVGKTTYLVMLNYQEIKFILYILYILNALTAV